MKRVVNKLSGRRGATMLFAILVFMLCILAGTAALTAAAANSGRYTHLKEDQKQYLSMSSAVKLLRGELSGKTFTAKAKVTEVEETVGVITTTTRTVDWSDTDKEHSLLFESSLRGLVINQLEKLFEYGVWKTFGTSVTLSPATGSDFAPQSTKPGKLEKTYIINAGDEMYKVTAKMAMETVDPGTDGKLLDKDFYITIEFSFGTATNYATTMTLLATFADGAGENGLKSNQISKTTTYHYDSVGAIIETIVTTETEYTLEVQWLEENTHVAAVEPTGSTGP